MSKTPFQDQLKQLSKQAKAQRQQQQEEARQQQQSQTEDIDFAKEMGTLVTPLKPRNQFQHPRNSSAIKIRAKSADELIDDSSYFYIGDSQQDEAPAFFSKNGRGKQDIQRLQAKHYPIVAYVDLHGYRQDEAQETLNEFIEYVQQHGVVGEIVHGSGLGSKNYQPVLKNLVRRWLMQHPQVLAYAQPNERNDGAVYVLVKRKQRHPNTDQ